MNRRSPPPCRLTALLAREAPVGVIFRRGPSKWVQLIKWNTRSDTFEEGQWFHGRIYDGRSDLSPDGSLLIYFASKFNPRTLKDNEYTYAWTAISRPPFFTALALWPKGDCWHGGGLFTSQRDVFLNHRPEAAKPHPGHLPKGVRVTVNPSASGEDDPVLIPRMERGGWKFLQSLKYDPWERRTVQPAIMEKRHRKGGLTLRIEKFFDRGEEQWLCSLVTKQGKQFEIGVGTWADFDQQGRLVFAARGKLLSIELKRGEVVVREFRDFNQFKPQEMKTPWKASKW
jgi:hypothetical protein